MHALAAALALTLLAPPLRASGEKPPVLVGRVVDGGKPVYLNDRLTTGASGRLQIRLQDGTIFTIGPNSSIVIDEFVYVPSRGLGRVTASVLRGVFHFITGKVGKKHPENMKVILPACTIGINGTEVMGRIEAGRDVVVLSTGAITVGNDAGTARLARAGFAVNVAAGQAPGEPYAAPLPLLASLMKALAPDQRAGNGASDGKRGCSRSLRSFKTCVQRKVGRAGEAGLDPAILVDFDEIADALVKLDDAALAEELKKAWLAQLEKARVLQTPPAPVAQWLLKQGTPIKAFIRSAASPEAQAAKDDVAARYGLTPEALARLDGMFK